MTYKNYVEWGTSKHRSALLDDECVKCGSLDNSFRFHDWCDLSDDEHLHYSCYTCGYAWAGQTVEQIRNESGYFDGYKSAWTAGGILSEGDWSDWDDDYDYRVARAEADKDEFEYLGIYEREDGPVLSER